MPRLLLLLTLVSMFLAVSLTTRGETPDQTLINLSLDASIDALAASDFPRLVTLLHPAAQRLFRDQLSGEFDLLLRVHPLDQLTIVSGLPQHPKDLGLSDAEFFVAACENSRLRHPDLVDKRWFPLREHGSIFDSDSVVHLTLSYAGRVRTERTDYTFVRPLVISFRRESHGWYLWSAPLADRIAAFWKQDLLAQQ
ncbi:MAG TPA: hypothetical protein VGG94_07865 [Chthoniobacterales bacterium]|jgi:hypothetical protein